MKKLAMKPVSTLKRAMPAISRKVPTTRPAPVTGKTSP